MIKDYHFDEKNNFDKQLDEVWFPATYQLTSEK